MEEEGNESLLVHSYRTNGPSKFSFQTPSSLEKQMLLKAGFGLKKINLHPNDDEDTVKEKITSDMKDSDGNAASFLALRSCGGFELMQRSTTH